MFSLMTKLFLNKQIQFDDGKLEILGIRDCFTPLVTYCGIQKAIVDKQGSRIVYSSAKSAGYNWFKKMAEVFPGLTPTKAIEWGINFISLSGWGNPKIEKLDVKLKQAVFILENSTLAKEYGKNSDPVDHLFRGLLAGGLSFSLKADLDCFETHCISMGSHNCRFVVADKKILKEKFNFNDS